MLYPSLSCFGWKLIHTKHPMQSWAQNIDVNLASRCCLCNNCQETDLLFFNCSFASNIWTWILQVAGSLVPTSLSSSVVGPHFLPTGIMNLEKVLNSVSIHYLLHMGGKKNLIFNDCCPSLAHTWRFPIDQLHYMLSQLQWKFQDDKLLNIITFL